MLDLGRQTAPGKAHVDPFWGGHDGKANYDAKFGQVSTLACDVYL